MKHVVIVICDGLRRDMVNEANTPNLCRVRQHGTWFEGHTGVFPSTTRTTAASIATGCQPGRHGLEGNAVALDLGIGPQVHSVGPPEFRDKLLKATGQTLRVPTMSERVAKSGGAKIYANASPGAGIFLDPDGYGFLRHRNVAWAPGRVEIQPLGVSHDTAGDAAMTQMFIDDVVLGEKPALGVLWQCEPDNVQHGVPLGSSAHLDAIRAADAQAGRVFDNLREDIEAGNVLFICASDHGHETVTKVFDLEEFLVSRNFKQGQGSTDIAVAPQGLSATITLSEKAKPNMGAIVAALASLDEVGSVFHGDELSALGIDMEGNVDLVVVGASDDALNEVGIPGSSVAFQGDIKISNNVGCGQHGGLGKYEQSPFLICAGPTFRPGSVIDERTSAIDIAPSAMRHLDLPAEDMDGRALQL